MDRATLWLDGGQVVVKAKYIQRYVDQLKADIPPQYREWDGDAKVWRVDACYADEIESLTRVYYQTEVLISTFPSSLSDGLVKAVCGLTAGDRKRMRDVMWRAATNKYSRTLIEAFFDSVPKISEGQIPAQASKHICIVACKSPTIKNNTIKIVRYLAQKKQLISIIAVDGAGEAELLCSKSENTVAAELEASRIGPAIARDACDLVSAFVLAYYSFMPDNPHFLVLVDRPILNLHQVDEYIAEHWQGRRIDLALANETIVCELPLSEQVCKIRKYVGVYDVALLDNQIRSIDI